MTIRSFTHAVLVGITASVIQIGFVCVTTADDDKEPIITISPSVRYITVDGDKNRFRQNEWIIDSWAGGIEELSIQHKIRGSWTLLLESRTIFDEEDYKVRLEIVNPSVGFLHAGYTEYRKYFDDSGGFFVFPGFGATSLNLGRDLHLDIGKFYVEFGLTLPDLPKLVFGYEYKIKDGAKSMVEWGRVNGGGQSRNIFPASKEIDETTHILRAEIYHTIENVELGNQFRYERYDSDAMRLDDVDFNLGSSAPGKTVTVRESYEHDAFFNTFHMESHVNEKTYWSAGYLFSTLDGEPGFAVNTIVDPSNGGSSSGSDKFWNILNSMVDQDSHVLNLNTMFGPFRKTYFYGGIQAEKTGTDAFSDVDLAEQGAPNEAGVINTRNNKDWFQERVGVRFMGIPFTTVYVEGKWDQGTVALFEEEVITGLTDPTELSETTQRFTDTNIERQDYRVGLNAVPMKRTSFSTYYRRKTNDNQYDNLIDQELAAIVSGTTNIVVTPQSGYSAFIDNQKLTTDEISTKLTIRPTTKLSLSLRYQLLATDIDTQFESSGASGQSGNYDSHVYSVSATLIPASKIHCTALFTFQDTRTAAQDNGSLAVTTFEGDVYSVLGTIGYAFDEATDMRGEYSFSTADNFTDNSAAGLPFGADFERHGVLLSVRRKITENLIAHLRYGYYKFIENSTGGLNDYEAHLASMNWIIRF